MSGQIKITVRDFRCSCGKLLFRGHIPSAPGVVIEIRCRCGKMNVIESEIKHDPVGIAKLAPEPANA
jgi:hypothetical protein